MLDCLFILTKVDKLFLKTYKMEIVFLKLWEKENKVLFVLLVTKNKEQRNFVFHFPLTQKDLKKILFFYKSQRFPTEDNDLLILLKSELVKQS
jgi:hypothetical protein